MRTLVLSLAALLTAPSAFAEVRLMNGTGRALVVDVLHAEKQERDISLAADNTAISKVYGPALEKNKTQMLVVRDAASGKELKREAVQTNSIIAINNWGDGVIFNYAGRFQGDSDDGGALLFINTTGKPLAYKAEKADFSLREGKGREPRDINQVVFDTIPNIGKEGAPQKVELSVVGTEVLKAEVAIGGLYLVRRAGDKALEVSKVR